MKKFNEIHSCYFLRDRRKKISLHENGKKYHATNPDEKYVAQYRVDDPDEQNVENKKCDYALYIFDDEEAKKDDDRLIFIELKGKDIARAIKQISKSIETWVVAHDIWPRKMDARVVAAGYPNPKYVRSDELRLNKTLYKYGKGELKVSSNGRFEENL
ncbi:hypothetical protein SAMN05216331_12218 [Porphyromonadaceae bacterium KH3R12]|nr:hypothetical protein SAMN05216331_12218 [Porphyromonadaceae bacterium KH3R12]